MKGRAKANWKKVERLLAEAGFEKPKPGDPIYSEGPSMTFLPRMPDPSASKTFTSTSRHTASPPAPAPRRRKRR
jgi:hypothetical protein